MGTKLPQLPPSGHKPLPPPAPPPKKQEISQGVDLEFIHAGLLQTYTNLNNKYEELCKTVDNLLGHDAYHLDHDDHIVCQFCNYYSAFRDRHKDNCPWKKLQDLMNG